MSFLKDKIDKCFFIILCTLRVPTEIQFNVRLLLIYAVSVVIYSYFYSINYLGQLFLFIIGSSIILFYYYTFSDIIYYGTYYNTQKYIKNLKLNKQDKNVDLENFQISYNKLRILLKKRIKAFTDNLLSHDYKTDCILQKIDIFFDVTINILFKRGVMNISYTPDQEYSDFIEEVYPDPDVGNEPEEITPPIDAFDYEFWKIIKIDYEALDKFIDSFGNVLIKSSRPKSINLYVIEEFFDKWTSIIEDHESELLVQSRNKVTEHYNKMETLNEKKNEQRERIIELILTNFIAIVIAGMIGLLVYFLTNL